MRPAAKTALTLLFTGAFVGGVVALILWALPRQRGAVVPWTAGGGAQPEVARGPGRAPTDGAPPAAPAPAPPGPAPAAPATAAAAGPRGLRLELEDPASGERSVRRARLLALGVARVEPAAPRIGWPFRATFTGSVGIDLRDRYRFAFAGTGHLELEVDGKVVLRGEGAGDQLVAGDSVRLGKGNRRLIARYASPAEGDARVRVFWSTSEFAWEPLPPSALEPEQDEALAAGLASRDGRALIERLQCAGCHAGGPAPWPSPALDGIGARRGHGWLHGWLLTPERGAATVREMPHLFGDDATGRQEAADVAAYLASLREGEPPPPPVTGDAAAGGALFARLGCIGCHTRPDAPPGADPARVPLRAAAARFPPGALVDFLLAPQRHDPASPMPDFALETSEAVALAAFLRAGAPAPPAPPAGDAARGRDLAEAKGCANCHTGLGVSPRPASPWSAVLPALGARGDCAGPARYPLADAERALLAGLAGLAASAPEPAVETAERLLTSLRCTACHVLDGATDAWTAHAGEVAALLPAAGEAHGPEQVRPPLTWAGEKLRPSFLRQQLTDVRGARSRPWLHARMPSFPAYADVLVRGLAASHGLAAVDPPPPEPDPESARIGGDLVSAEKGFACVTCHGVAGRPPLQVFEVQGVDFALAARRLRHDYFMRWMRDPHRIDPATKMARYASAEGKTGFTQIYGGDAERQFEAIGAWMRGLEAR